MLNRRLLLISLPIFVFAILVALVSQLVMIGMKQLSAVDGGEAAPLLRFNAADFLVISAGQYSTFDTTLAIEEFNGDEAIIVLSTTPFDSGVYPFFQINISNLSRYTKAKLLWTLEESPDEVHGKTLIRDGDKLAPISFIDFGNSYDGVISSMALLLYESAVQRPHNNNQVLQISGMQVEPFTHTRALHQVWSDWTVQEPRVASMNNLVKGGATNSVLMPNELFYSAIAIAMVTTLLAFSTRRMQIAGKHGSLFQYTLAYFLYAALCTDILRFNWRFDLITDNFERYAFQPIEERIKNGELRCARFQPECKADLLPFF